MRGREIDAVREARDAAVALAVVVLPVAAVALVVGRLVSETAAAVKWLIGPLLVALLLLATLCFALLAADRVARRVLSRHAFPLGRGTLAAASLVAGVVLVAGLPATWPVLIGFGVVCLLLGALVVAGALLDL